MNQPARIAFAGGMIVGQLLTFAFLAMAAVATIHWIALWCEARQDG